MDQRVPKRRHIKFRRRGITQKKAYKKNWVKNNYGIPKPYFAFYYLRTYLLTYSMEQSPSWEANRFSASQEIPRILGNPKVHYRIHKCPPYFPILIQLHPVHNPTSHFLKMRLNISSPLGLGLPSGLFSSGLPTKTPYKPLSHTLYMPSPSHSSLFYHPNNIGWVQLIQFLIIHV